MVGVCCGAFATESRSAALEMGEVSELAVVVAALASNVCLGRDDRRLEWRGSVKHRAVGVNR